MLAQLRENGLSSPWGCCESEAAPRVCAGSWGYDYDCSTDTLMGPSMHKHALHTVRVFPQVCGSQITGMDSGTVVRIHWHCRISLSSPWH